MPNHTESTVREKAGEGKREGKSMSGHGDEVAREQKRHSPLEDLSRRESEVFRLIGQGRSTREIAELLHISAKTVESYQAHIKEKLSLRNARELVQHAIEWTLTNERK
jgi:DNA-binding CsgD family transcriptional regulator